ncbi:PHD finger-like domain-containing protein 5A [Sinocyclocheilus grahami]|uniref:PHD finger-like domain-containing protein 5A n=1 Tax=Sinocyclocheilus grahami TaxID=75366 RepID=UPI0007AC7CE2|nr:PREDICTED: PHD finger-like domain-containing protein 5A [Sinocyclocheilus grahami]XP_016091853.1 PREDICTED: PHD finger-like domain-containing protein 5A [Sinocyclocheilus grahami]
MTSLAAMTCEHFASRFQHGHAVGRFGQGRCVICGGPGVSDAYYCKECTIQEKDRDGCPKIVNLGISKTDLFYERKLYGFKKRRRNRGTLFVARVSTFFSDLIQ